MGFRNTELSKWIAGGLAAFVAAIILTGCGAKLSVANEQFERGEYFDAQKTYRKVYNKLTKREQRPQRGLPDGSLLRQARHECQSLVGIC